VVSTLATHIPRTLIADDQPDVLAALRLLLKGEGYQTESANSPKAVLDAIRTSRFDLVLMDLNYARDTTSGKEGLELISRIQAADRSLPIVVMTAWGTVDLAVEAMHRGVRDFVEKPWENARLLQILRRQIDQGRTLSHPPAQVSRPRAFSRKLEFEFKEAREIQRQLMPAAITRFDGCDISCAWRAARQIGGDYLGVLPFGKHHAALCISDVAGKGLPAALMMSNMQAALKSTLAKARMPREVCASLNQLICGNIPANRFITCFYGLLDLRHRTLRFTNAGHNPPMLVQCDGRLRRLEKGGRVLGAFSDSSYGQAEFQLCAGDRLLLFTDGLTEARNAAGEEFGETRLRELLVQEHRRTAAELQSIIMQTVSSFCDDRFDDDVALMIVEVK
jgi:phosphoserine phosphatase RsbU/P